MTKKKLPTIYLGTDHAAFQLKEDLKKYLTRAGYKIIDKGAHRFSPQDDYPDFVIPAAQGAAKSHGKAVAIVLGGSGNGECMAANKVRGARAALVYDAYTARLCREHNDANVMCLGSRTSNMSPAKAKRLVKLWLKTESSKAARHQRRIKKIHKFERNQ